MSTFKNSNPKLFASHEGPKGFTPFSRKLGRVVQPEDIIIIIIIIIVVGRFFLVFRGSQDWCTLSIPDRYQSLFHLKLCAISRFSGAGGILTKMPDSHLKVQWQLLDLDIKWYMVLIWYSIWSEGSRWSTTYRTKSFKPSLLSLFKNAGDITWCHPYITGWYNPKTKMTKQPSQGVFHCSYIWTLPYVVSNNLQAELLPPEPFFTLSPSSGGWGPRCWSLGDAGHRWDARPRAIGLQCLPHGLRFFWFCWAAVNSHLLVGGWTNPFEKICLSNLDHLSPQVPGWNCLPREKLEIRIFTPWCCESGLLLVKLPLFDGHDGLFKGWGGGMLNKNGKTCEDIAKEKRKWQWLMRSSNEFICCLCFDLILIIEGLCNLLRISLFNTPEELPYFSSPIIIKSNLRDVMFQNPHTSKTQTTFLGPLKNLVSFQLDHHLGCSLSS